MLVQSQALLSNLAIERMWSGAGERQAHDAEVFHSRYEHGVDILCMIGGNRSGKSVCAGWMCIGQHLRDYSNDQDVYWCVAPTVEKSIAGQQKELWQALPHSMFGAKVAYDEKRGFGGPPTTIVLSLPNDRGTCVVRFKTAAQYDSDPASFEQEKVAGIWVDETIPEGLFDRLVARVLDLRGFILISTIPDADWMSERFEDSKPGEGVHFSKYCMSDNAHNLPEGTIERALRDWTDEESQMRIYGNFRFLSGRVYKEFIRELCPAGHLVKPFPIPSSWPKWRGLDHGHRHPTVCLWMALAPNDTAYIYREYYQTEKAVPVHARNILLRSSGERYVCPVVADPAIYKRDQANLSSIADEYLKCGLRCRPARRCSRNEGEWAQVQLVKRWLLRRGPLGPALQVFQDCQGLISDMRRWKYKSDREGKPLDSDSFQDRDNDGCDVLRYLLTQNPEHHTDEIEVVNSLHGYEA